jgi:hypothetical protein
MEHDNSLGTFAASVAAEWAPISSALVADCTAQMKRRLRADPSEDWLAALHRDAPAGRELVRDPAHGFMLLAHAENSGLYRPPHDHGRGWVVYGIQHGELEIRTFARVPGEDGAPQLVQRDATILRAGDALPYLPGDIHDTRCLSARALLLRFSVRDLRQEDRDGYMTRYPGVAVTADEREFA